MLIRKERRSTITHLEIGALDQQIGALDLEMKGLQGEITNM